MYRVCVQRVFNRRVLWQNLRRETVLLHHVVALWKRITSLAHRAAPDMRREVDVWGAIRVQDATALATIDWFVWKWAAIRDLLQWSVQAADRDAA